MFLSRLCSLFMGLCLASPHSSSQSGGKQTFYLIDENESAGKGANSVISCVPHYSRYFGLGETDAQFHFDNCTGQNKNNFVPWYALWRVIVGLHKTVTYRQMIAGHTNFEPDWNFGIRKTKWRHCNAETLQDVATTVSLSSRARQNIPQLVNDSEKPFFFIIGKNFYLSSTFH